MAVYAISDLHVHQEHQPYLFTSEKEAIFVHLAAEILETGAKLVIAGDFIDFTGMANPRRGHLEFFQELFSEQEISHPAIQEALEWQDEKTQLERIGGRFPKLYESLGRLAEAGSLILIPGNHDCAFRDPAIQGAFAELLGVPADRIQWQSELRVGKVAFAKHGNDFDPSNRTRGGCENPGVAITSALYQALMPALVVMGLPENIVYAIPAVRPEELVIEGIERYLGRDRARRVVAAFVGLIAKNGYFRGWKRALTYPIQHHLPGLSDFLRAFLTPRRLASALRDETQMRRHVREKAEQLQARLVPPADIVVLGHTHELDRTAHYINIGTWIDHLTGISLLHLETRDLSLPVLRIKEESQECAVFDARGMISGSQPLERCRTIL